MPDASGTPAAEPPVTAGPAVRTRPGRARWAAGAVFAATVGQLLVAVLWPDLPQFQGKAFAARLAAYPALMLLAPALWWAHGRWRPHSAAPPWDAFVLLMLPFAIDVTGNTLDLYDRVGWWDDANHLVNWFLLCLGAGRLLEPARVRPRWALALLVAGLGALLAVGWELAEWYAFIRHGTELDTAYTDTIGDEALGCLGAAAAGALVAYRGLIGAAAGPGTTAPGHPGAGGPAHRGVVGPGQ